MNLELGGKTFISKKVKTRILREAIAITENLDFNNLKIADLDQLVNFVCRIYGDQFDADFLYDNLDADLLAETLANAVQGVVSPSTNVLATFPQK